MVNSFLWAPRLYETLNLTPEIQGHKHRKEEIGYPYQKPNGRWIQQEIYWTHGVLWQPIKLMGINRRMHFRMRKVITILCSNICWDIALYFEYQIVKGIETNEAIFREENFKCWIISNLCHMRSIFKYLMSSVDSRFIVSFVLIFFQFFFYLNAS